MRAIQTSRRIDAPVDQVFRAVAHAEDFQQVVDEILRIELLSEQRTGVGTRFAETREVNGREATVELEVREYEPGERVRIISDEGGTVWDTTFRVSRREDRTELEMRMEARPHKLWARLLNPFIAGMVRRAVARDMDAVKAHCEREAVGGTEEG